MRTTSEIIRDAVELLVALQSSVTGFLHGRATWAESIPERALMSLARFPQPESCIESDGKKTSFPFHARLMYACGDDLDAIWDEIEANRLPTDDLRGSFIRVKFLLLGLTGSNSRMDGKQLFEHFSQSLWELRQMLGVTALQADEESGGKYPKRETEAEQNRLRIASAESVEADAEEFLKASDPKAKLYRDGNQWCDKQYARTLGISAQHIDRARKAEGLYEVQLTDRRKADDVGKPFVYRRAELIELSEAIPEEFRVQPE